MKRFKIISYLSGLSLLLVARASAQGLRVPTRPTGLPGSEDGRLSTSLLFYINVFLGIVGLIAVAFIIIGGFRYITSAGNEEAAEGGKKMITDAIIGLVVIILSYTIITVIMNALVRGNV